MSSTDPKMALPSSTLMSPVLRLLETMGLRFSVRRFERVEADLRSYQHWMADQIERLPGVLLAAEMGTGKTAASLTAARRLLRAGRIKRVIVIAPLRVAIDTWPDEIREWEHFADLQFAVCCGTEAERLAALAERAEITIINRENLQWLFTAIGGLPGWDWDMVIYDESSRLNGFTLRSQQRPKTDILGDAITRKAPLSEWGVLATVRPKVKKIVELTGTPTPKGLLSLGGQLFLIDGGKRLGTTKTAFKSRWFDESRWTHKIEPKEFAFDQIMSRVNDVMFSLKSDDYIKLPPTIFVDRYVKMAERLQKQYDDFEKEMYNDVHDVEACSKGVLTNKLLQFANGGLYRTPEGVINPERQTIQIHDHKLEMLDSIIEECNGANILIAYNFEFDLKKIRKRYPKIVVFDETPDFKARWNRGEIALAAAHPASIGHGQNIQKGGHIQIWYGLTWNLEWYLQFNKRLARSGQSNEKVWIYRIITRNTVDETVLRTTQIKNATQDTITDAVRVRVNPEYGMAA